MQKIGFCDKYSLTKAVLDGAKSMTRRLEKELDRLVSEYQMRYEEPIRIVEQKWDKDKNCLLLYAHSGIADTDREHVLRLRTRYKVGEIVAVAQAYKDAEIDPHYLMFDTLKEKFSCAEKEIEAMATKGWSNKLFVKPVLMSHQIQITSVRVEKLQDISDGDCLNEGIYRWKDMEDCPKSLTENQRNRFGYYGVWDVFSTPREAFADLIDRPGVGRKGLWESNPWVICYSFQLVK